MCVFITLRISVDVKGFIYFVLKKLQLFSNHSLKSDSKGFYNVKILNSVLLNIHPLKNPHFFFLQNL